MIVELYWQRSENALTESKNKYERYCGVIAENILKSKEDAEECVNDTWIRAWNSIPDKRPNRLSVFLGKITRNIAIDRYRKKKSQKNNAGETALCLDELAECIGENECFTDKLVLKELVNTFLAQLNDSNRKIFMYRYWYMCSIKEVAKLCDMSEGAVKMSLQRTRKSFEEFLKKEGINI